MKDKVDSPPTTTKGKMKMVPPPDGSTKKKIKADPPAAGKSGKSRELDKRVSGSISLEMRKKIIDEGVSMGLTKKQIIIDMAEKLNEPIPWYVPRTEAMEILINLLKSSPDGDNITAIASKDDMFFINYLGGQCPQLIHSMDEVRALVYLKDNYNWPGPALTPQHDGAMSLKNALAQHGIDCYIFHL